jgi:NDP-sugar pyrophosphorylase family protein
MDLKAILLVGGIGSTGPDASTETLAAVPLAYLDVLGATVLERVVRRLRQLGVSSISLISGASDEVRPYAERAALCANVSVTETAIGEFWERAEESFEQFRQDGAELVLIVRIGPYIELDYEELIQHHIDKHCRMTSVISPEGEPLGTFVVDASRRADASMLLGSALRQVRDDCERFQAQRYINPLRTAGDLRRLALDAFLEKNSIRPVGREIKPGVWVADGARIHRKARVVAPAYVGAYSKVRAAALVTRTSVIEHHAEVDCGTVVENSTILPFTYVGAGLDVMHSVVGFRRLAHLVRNVEVEISDARLIGISAAEAISRLAGSAAALFAFLPKQIYRGFFGRPRQVCPAELPEALAEPAAALETPDVKEPASGQEVSEFPSSFAVVRRYGEH